MSTTRTKGKLLYSLSTRPPIPFPLHPSYPIQLPTQDLPLAYFDSLWTTTQSDHLSLESFARLLLALRAQRPPKELEILLRSLVRPLHDFDNRWRNTIPDLLEQEEEEDGVSNRDGVEEKEKEMLFKAYEKWEVAETKRLEEEKANRQAKGKEKARDQDKMDEDEEQRYDTVEDEEVRSENWVTEREVYETRLQALLLLTLLSLPPNPKPPTPKKKGKGRKKKDPERDSATLDPALLLDFLTDRLQIWRVMQDISLDDELDSQDRSKKEVVETKDTVQEWWSDIVEPLFRNDVDAEVIMHHRSKLFPDGIADLNTNSNTTLYEERSLMSLDKSARRRDLRDSQALVAESPTMKRLLSMPSLAREAREKGNGEDFFKMPLAPIRRNGSNESSLAEESGGTGKQAQEGDSAARTRLPRKQERPRPLPRGDSATSNMRDMLKRREVSLARKTSTAGVKKKTKDSGEGNEIGRKRKRKSASPQKLAASSLSAETLILVPDTPAKPVVKAPSFKKPFSRAISLPSFAALGAAFRPGAPDHSLPLPFGIPPPPILPGDRRDDMDWDQMGAPEGSDEEEWLVSRKEDFRSKGGHDRKTSGSTEDEDDGQPEGDSMMDTPKKIRTVLVADTPS